MRTLKGPKLIFNKKYISKISISSSKNNIILSEINKDLIAIKAEIAGAGNEIASLREMLSKLKESYGYLDFVEEREKQIAIERENAYKKLHNITSPSSDNAVTTQALTVVKKRLSFKCGQHHEKSCEVLVKVAIDISNIVFFEFVYINKEITK